MARIAKVHIFAFAYRPPTAYLTSPRRRTETKKQNKMKKRYVSSSLLPLAPREKETDLEEERLAFQEGSEKKRPTSIRKAWTLEIGTATLSTITSRSGYTHMVNPIFLRLTLHHLWYPTAVIESSNHRRDSRVFGNFLSLQDQRKTSWTRGVDNQGIPFSSFSIKENQKRIYTSIPF